jgi:hypothetical protein
LAEDPRHVPAAQVRQPAVFAVEHPLTPGGDEGASGLVQVIAPAPLPIVLPHVDRGELPQKSVSREVVRQFVQAAQAVADAMLVTSGFVDGEGRMLVRLHRDVLNGSEIHLVAKGGSLTIVVHPATQDVQAIVEANRAQFEQHIAQKVPSWRVAVAVKRGELRDDERA